MHPEAMPKLQNKKMQVPKPQTWHLLGMFSNRFCEILSDLKDLFCFQKWKWSRNSILDTQEWYKESNFGLEQLE